MSRQGGPRPVETAALPPALFAPFLTVLVGLRAVSPLLVAAMFASVARSPADRRALLWLVIAATAVLGANLGFLAWLLAPNRRAERIRHPATIVADVAVMVALLLSNAVVVSEQTFLLEARDVFNIYVMGTAVVWVYLRRPWTGVAILGIGAVAQAVGVVVNGYALEAVSSLRFWIRQIWGPVAVVLVSFMSLVVRRAVAEQREGAQLMAQAERERADMAALAQAHDEVLPLLAAIVRATEAREGRDLQLERIRRLAQQADDVVREVFERQPSVGGQLIAGVDELVHGCRERQREAPRPTRVQLFVPDYEPDLPGDARQALLAATEQALRNAEQHGRAEVVTVSVEADDDEVRVVVADDGIGFEPEAVGKDRFGVRGSIRGRLESVGGRAVLDTAPQHGCVWELAVSASPPKEG